MSRRPALHHAVHPRSGRSQWTCHTRRRHQVSSHSVFVGEKSTRQILNRQISLDLCRNFFLHLEPLEVCLEEAFLDDIRKFVLMLPFDKMLIRIVRSNATVTSEAILNQMLQTAVDNTRRKSTCTATDRWCGLLARHHLL